MPSVPGGVEGVAMDTASQKPEVKILLADDEAFMREIIVNALSAGGYREIRPLAKLEALQEVVESYFPDLLVINGEMGDGQALEIVRRIRHFRMGRNPFLPIVVTSWNSEGPFVRKVVDCGADVLMIKPLAAGQLLVRLDFLVTSRPPFVATASYMGPDRRQTKRGGSSNCFDVPNTLKERVEGMPFEPAKLEVRIAKSFTRLKEQRKEMQEQKIGKLVSTISAAVREQDAVDNLDEVMETMATAAALYAREFAAASQKNPADFARSVMASLMEIATSDGNITQDDFERLCSIVADLGVEVPSASDVLLAG